MTRSSALGLTLFLSLLPFACGGSSGKSLFDDVPLPGSGGAASAAVGGSENAGGDPSAGTGGAGEAIGDASAGGQGAGTAGAGGRVVSDAGTGGIENAGGRMPEAGATGGAPSTDAGTGEAGGEPTIGVVRCGTDVCDVTAGEVCCTSMNSGGGVRSQCSTSRSGCTRAFECDGHGDCERGEQCCLVYAGQSLSPSTVCQADCTAPVECGGPSDCARDEVCCGNGIDVVVGTRYMSISCQSSCTGTGNYILCDSGESCPGDTSCLPSSHFPPGYPVCK